MPRVTAHNDTKKPKFAYVPRPESQPKRSWWVTETPGDRAEFTQNFAAEESRIIANSSPTPTAKEVGSAVEIAAKRKAGHALDLVGLSLRES